MHICALNQDILVVKSEHITSGKHSAMSGTHVVQPTRCRNIKYSENRVKYFDKTIRSNNKHLNNEINDEWGHFQ